MRATREAEREVGLGGWVRAPRSAVRLKVTLQGLKPPVWRRLLVGDTTSLGELHFALQAAMGWDNSHLHMFEVGRKQYGDPSMFDVEHEEGVAVGALVGSGLKKFSYTYDMGDDWEHAIAIEGTEPIDPARAYPACVDGKRACPARGLGRPLGLRPHAGGGRQLGA